MISKRKMFALALAFELIVSLVIFMPASVKAQNQSIFKNYSGTMDSYFFHGGVYAYTLNVSMSVETEANGEWFVGNSYQIDWQISIANFNPDAVKNPDNLNLTFHDPEVKISGNTKTIIRQTSVTVGQSGLLEVEFTPGKAVDQADVQTSILEDQNYNSSEQFKNAFWDQNFDTWINITEAAVTVPPITSTPKPNENNNLTPSPTLLWNYTTSNGVWSSPTVDNGVLYVGCEDIVYTGIPYGQGLQYFYAGNLYAINAASGAKLWNYSIPVGGSSPAVAGGIVYVGSFDGNIYAFNATNGVKLWNYPTGDVVSSSPAVSNGIVYIGLSDGDLVALNGTTGELVWQHHSLGGVSSPLVKDGVVFASSTSFIPISTFNSGVYALNATNGKMLWNFSTNNSVAFPTVFGKTLYVGVGSNVSALNSIDGSQLWSKNISKQISLSPPALRPTAVLGNVLFVGSSDGSVYALDTADGEKIWNQSLGNLSETSPYAVNDVTSPAAVNGEVYIGSYDGNLYSLNATNGEILWNYTISDRDHAVQSSPIVVDGVVYIGSGDHHVYALTISQTSKNQIPTSTILATVLAAIAVIAFLTLFLVFRRHRKTAKFEYKKSTVECTNE